MVALLFPVPTPLHLQSQQNSPSSFTLCSRIQPLPHPLLPTTPSSLHPQIYHRTPPEPVCDDDWPFDRRMEQALHLLDLMEAQGLEPDPDLFCTLLNSCAQAQNLEFGKTLHSKIIGTRFANNVFVVNNLISLYVKCGCVGTARDLFDEMPHRNAASWTSVISMYNQLGVHEEALKLYNLMMLERQVRPNVFTYTVALNSCAKTRNLKMGVEIHEGIVRDSCESDGFIITALIDMYSKCGVVESARRVFDEMGDELVLPACTAMVDGYNMNYQAKEALKLIRRTLHRPKLELQLVRELGFSCMIKSCIMESTLRQGQDIHAHMIKFGHELGSQTIRSFITLYEKCNMMASAHCLFDELVIKNVELCGKMISGYVRNGLYHEAMQLYYQMVYEDIDYEPCVLSWIVDACVGLKGLKEGREIHGRAIKAGYVRSVESLVVSLVKMYREFGLVDEVHKVSKYYRTKDR